MSHLFISPSHVQCFFCKLLLLLTTVTIVTLSQLTRHIVCPHYLQDNIMLNTLHYIMEHNMTTYTSSINVCNVMLMYQHLHCNNPQRPVLSLYSKLNQTRHVLRVLPEKSQHTTTTLTWSFNDAYKSQWGEIWLQIPQIKKQILFT